MLFWAQGAISPLGLYILSSNFSSKPFVFLSRFLFSSLFILTSLCFPSNNMFRTGAFACWQWNLRVLLSSKIVAGKPFVIFMLSWILSYNLLRIFVKIFSSFSFSRIVFQFAAAPLPPMEREANFNRLKDDPLDLPRWRCGFQGRRFSSSTLWKKRLPWNPALSLLLAKFFALFAIFLCQLLFPNKQHLHRF